MVTAACGAAATSSFKGKIIPTVSEGVSQKVPCWSVKICSSRRSLLLGLGWCQRFDLSSPSQHFILLASAYTRSWSSFVLSRCIGVNLSLGCTAAACCCVKHGRVGCFISRA